MRRINVHSGAWLDEVDNQQAQDQGECRKHFKVDERSSAHTAELLHVLHLGDAQHHRGENDGCEYHLDQLDERIAKRFQVSADIRPKNT
ncbi:hypothetical protein D3C78_753320 [compost metagenome]